MHSPIESSPDHIRLLGIITARWATLDIILSEVLAQLIGHPLTGQALYFCSNSQRLRFDLILTALHLSGLLQNTQKEHERILSRIGDLWSRRSEIVHNPHIASAIGPHADFSSLITRPLRKQYQETKPLKLKELREHADAVSTVGDELLELTFPGMMVTPRKAQADASRDKPPPQEPHS
jgi:hypothetical protein